MYSFLSDIHPIAKHTKFCYLLPPKNGLGSTTPFLVSGKVYSWNDVFLKLTHFLISCLISSSIHVLIEKHDTYIPNIWRASLRTLLLVSKINSAMARERTVMFQLCLRLLAQNINCLGKCSRGKHGCLVLGVSSQ